MRKFPHDVPKAKAVKALRMLGFDIPNHPTIKSSTLRTICTQTGIPREDFLRALERS